MSFTPHHLDYLQQRNQYIPPTVTDDSPTLAPPWNLRSLWRIKGIGMTEKHYKREQSPSGDKPAHVPSLDFLMGLSGFKVPVSFLVASNKGMLSLSVGTWSEGANEAAGLKMLASRSQMIAASLASSYRSVDLEAADPEMEPPIAGGLVVGIPTIKPADPTDGSLPMDRIVRALQDTSWTLMILAEPIDGSLLDRLRMKAAEELRTIQFYLQNSPLKDTMAEYYAELLTASVSDYTYGVATGAWRTSVYLLGSELGYPRLGAIWQGIFSGDRSLHLPLRIFHQHAVTKLARGWRRLDVEPPKGPGAFQHQYSYQTILTSEQLAAYIHLPRLETSGFSISTVATFDAMPPKVRDGEASIGLGKIVEGRRTTEAAYRMPISKLRSHALISGVTESGKTQTIFSILSQADQLNIPFLVIEPAKTEYRNLLGHPVLGKKLRVFTLGNERLSPFRLNPFEPAAGTALSVHVDMLRAAFNAGFGLWNPLPQVLEKCLYAVYVDRGWNLSSNTNTRGATTGSPFAYPTLTDLSRKVEQLTPQLGYKDDTRDEIRAALLTRINSLRIGGKGKMLDVRSSLPPEILFEQPTVLELEEMGDDDDKAFVMALILIRSWEYLRQKGETEDLRRLLVIEEAHRLLTNVNSQNSQEQGNPRAKAVEGFTNLLSEIRAYGLGVMIIDQVPVRLAPDAIKNTNLKIAHRVVALEDRSALAGSMAMNEQQSLFVSTLETGHAAIYSKGDDSPIHVKVEMLKEPLPSVSSEALHKIMAGRGGAETHSHWGCGATLETEADCELARTLAESREFQRDVTRLALAASLDASTLDDRWSDLNAHLLSNRRPHTDVAVYMRCVLARAAEIYADDWGSRMGVSYAGVLELAQALRQLLSDLSSSHASSLSNYLECQLRLSSRDFSPFIYCDSNCPQPKTCLYRHAATNVVEQGEFNDRWDDAMNSIAEEDELAKALWTVSVDAAQQFVGVEKRSSLAAAAMCFSQVKVNADRSRLGGEQNQSLDGLWLQRKASEYDS
jgi:hypothetical protein